MFDTTSQTSANVCSVILFGILFRQLECQDIRNYRAVYGKNTFANTYVISNVVGVSRVTCASLCTGTCHGFNFRKLPSNSGDCTLLSMEGSLSSVVTEMGSTYFERMDSHVCEDQRVCVGFGTGQTWAEAMEKCPRLYQGSHLLDIHSAAENQAIGDVLKKRPLANVFTYTAARRPFGGGRYDFVWMNSGEAVTYTNWGPGNPFEGSPGDHCVSMRKSTFTWNDASCTAIKRNYICQI